MNSFRGRRVLHLRSSGGLLGAENVVVEIAKFSPEYGYTSIVGAINNVNDPFPEFLSLASSLGIETVMFESKGPLDIKCIREIKSFIEKNNIDTIHTHGYKENIYTLLMNCATPKVATNHLWKGNSFRAQLYCSLDAILIRFFDKVVGVSKEIVSHMDSIKIKNTCMVSNGVDIEKYIQKPKDSVVMDKYDLSDTDYVLGMISSLTYEKNHKIILEALHKINNKKLKLLIVGGGVLQTEILNQVNDFNLNDRVIFAGAQKNIVEILSVIDVFLLPSLAEGLPMALLEAMACGKVVIASRVGEVPNVIQHGKNGLLVDPASLSQIVGEIEHLISNFSLISNYGDLARKTVVEGFSSRRMAYDYCSIYDELF